MMLKKIPQTNNRVAQWLIERAAMPQLTPTRSYEIGAAVWHYRCNETRTTVTKITRCQVMAFDAMSSRYLVVNIDNPHSQFYARRANLQPRYAGELGPEDAR